RPAPRTGGRAQARLRGRDHCRRLRHAQAGGPRLSFQLVTEITILVLAAFVGFEVISKVPTLLHTPLMSGTNAIHGIVIVWAILVTFLKDEVVTGWWWTAAGIAIGSVVGVVGARKVKMTAMPQMVALFNGVGGGAAALISLVEFHGVWAHMGRVGAERGI